MYILLQTVSENIEKSLNKCSKQFLNGYTVRFELY